MEGLELQSLSIWINVGAAEGKFGNSARSHSSLLWIYDTLRLWDARLMMFPGKHWRLPATTPENVPLIARVSTWWQVYRFSVEQIFLMQLIDNGQILTVQEVHTERGSPTQHNIDFKVIISVEIVSEK